MDLWCSESSSGSSCRASPRSDTQLSREESVLMSVADRTLLSPDSEVLSRLLETEARYVPLPPLVTYKCVQLQMKPHMRKTLATWMMEVSEEMGCDAIVFPLSINYLDRFLASSSVSKSQLQLLGAVCLLIASKVRQCRAIHPEALVFYSDYSFSTSDVVDWELLLLTKLKWDVSAVVSTDFVDHILVRLPLCFGESPKTTTAFKKVADALRRHSQAFTALCAAELGFSSQTPSLVATACLAVAVHGLSWPSKHWEAVHQVIADLHQITGIDCESIRSCMNQVEEVVASNALSLEDASNSLLANDSSASTRHSATNLTPSNCLSKTVILNEYLGQQPETPTDIQDIHF